MKEIILKSNYTNIETFDQSCISLKWSNLLASNIRLVANGNHKNVRLLVDKSGDSENDEKIINYINSLFVANPKMGFHINVEDQKCFEKAKKIIEKINSKEKTIKIFPDVLLKDRTSLDLSNLNCTTIVPLQYLMWHNNIENSDRRFLRFDRRDNSDYDGKTFFSETMNKGYVGSYYKLDEALKIKKIVLQILGSDLKFNSPHTDLEKVLLVSQYMSNHIIYPDYNQLTKKIKIIDRSADHNAYYTLLNKEGVCEGQAEAFMLLLNNPQMKVDCRVLVGLANKNKSDSGHAWNILRIQGSQYYYLFDQTWQNEDLDYEYTFSPLIKTRETLDGTGGHYRISNYKIPNDFLVVQLNQANEKEKNWNKIGNKIAIQYDLDTMIKNYQKK